tara:strand:- start:796 stop:1026 length:231 start_codon:yes stop_codon:yes gene_type:complete
MHNLDTIRAGVVIFDPDMGAEVIDAIGKKVGTFIRIKNTFHPDHDGASTFYYRTVLGNLTLESGKTCRDIFNHDVW